MIELFLIALVFIAYWDAIKNGFVIDDQEGILAYDGKLQGWNYGYFSRWLWHRIFQKEGRRHHLFSVIMHSANTVLLYYFLGSLFSNSIALFTAILFAVHPINVLSVAWASARSYLLGLFYSLLGLNLLQTHMTGLSTIPLFASNQPFTAIFMGLALVGYVFMYYLAIESQFTNMFFFIILALLGYYPLAILCFGVTMVLGGGIIKETITHRADTFKSQNLGLSTKLHHRKFIVVCKTLYYYTKLCLFPKRMGLYHVYNYHYDKKTEEEDYTFWLGFGLLLVGGYFLFTGPFIVKFAIVWYFSFVLIFLNWITIHQFVSERYCYVANIGLCLLLASVLIHCPIIMAFVVGVFIMRTWSHLPTFADEIPFYQSNIWNFPNSEVAFANLGVVYMKRGLMGSAMDMWFIGTNINKDYDVAWYNLSSTMKAQGQLHKARDFLKKAVESPQCHFKETWGKELNDLEHELNYLKEMDELTKELDKYKEDPTKLEIVKQIGERVVQTNKMHLAFEEKRKNQLTLVQQELSSMTVRKVQLDSMVAELQKGVNLQELVKMRDKQWHLVKEDALRQLKGVKNDSIPNT